MDELVIRIKRLERENEALLAKIKAYEAPGDMRAYYSMQRILNQQADFLNQFDLSSEIKMYDKENKTYDRASELWEKLPALISKLATLKTEINATGNETKDTVVKPSFLDRAIS